MPTAVEKEKKVYKPLMDLMQRYKVKLSFISPILGSAPADKAVYEKYVASKKPEATPEEIQQETALIPDLPPDSELGRMIFRVDPDTKNIIFLPHQIRGFMKEAASAVTGKGELSAFRSKIDRFVFIFPQDKIPIMKDGNPIQQPDGTNERPLRAVTPLGPRVTLVSSDEIGPGATAEFEIGVLPLAQKEVTGDMLSYWFQYGQLQGISQWRNGGYGRFTFTLEEQ